MEFRDIGTNKASLKTLWVFVSEDSKGNHGIMAGVGPMSGYPLVTLDERKVSLMRPLAKMAMQQSGHKVRLAKMTLESFEDI